MTDPRNQRRRKPGSYKETKAAAGGQSGSVVRVQSRLDDVETHKRDEGRLLEGGVHLSNIYAGLSRWDSTGGVQTSFLADRLGSCSV